MWRNQFTYNLNVETLEQGPNLLIGDFMVLESGESTNVKSAAFVCSSLVFFRLFQTVPAIACKRIANGFILGSYTKNI
jgi:hypothetical protein